ncbi:hypothetical protein [Zhihengliuella halotolerans]|uniref:Uncharacterized protein n=1 Tax=Zhihengliuella halotolerans TaxID=370736 RepID=A0A4Q8ACU5_9MICC|nr:hypothetical protein [Zhihengliuella halotolerans]RZU61561.1 hypothetical protein EV380_1132 [Zhihengliuella halotolerans]
MNELHTAPAAGRLPSRRRVLSAAVATAATSALLTLAPEPASGPGAAPQPVPVEPVPPRFTGEVLLGEPLHRVLVPVGAFGPLPDGTGVALMVASGSPGRLSVVRVADGQRLADLPLGDDDERRAAAWALAIDAATHTGVVGTTDGRVYVVDLATLTHRSVDNVPDDGPFFERAIPDGDGGFLMTSYGDGLVYRYTPATDTWASFGPFGSGNAYSIGLARAGAKVFVGTGTNDPAIYEFSLDGGEPQRIDLPPAAGGDVRSFVYDLAYWSGHLCARVDPENRLYVRDLNKDEWVLTLDDAAPGLAVSYARDESAGFYYAGLDQELRHLDPTRMEEPARPDHSVSAFRGHGWVPNAAGDRVLVTTNASGRMHLWNPRSAETELVDGDVAPGALLIRSVGATPDGGVLASAMATIDRVARYDGGDLAADFAPGGAEFTHLASSGQVESFGTSGGDVVVGSYPGARLRRLRDGADGPTAGTSGEEADGDVVVLAPDQDQDRPVDILDLRTRLVVATTPDYGQIDGAVVVVSPDFERQRTFRGLVPGQSPLCLAPFESDRVILVGTGSAAGLGAAPSEEDGRVLKLDLVSREVVASTVAVPGEPNVSALATDASGLVWGWTRNTLFQLDPVTMTIMLVRRYRIGRDTGGYVTGRQLHDGGDHLVGCAGGEVFRVDKATLAHELLAEGTNLHRSPGGDLYYSRGARLYRWVSGNTSATNLG